MGDFAVIYLCLDCSKYWSEGNNKRSKSCDHCDSQNRQLTASIDTHNMLSRLLNGQTKLDELKSEKSNELGH